MGSSFFNGLTPNDLHAHAVYVRYFTESFQSGSLGLETWDQSTAGGGAVFRVYQNLAHMMAALLNIALGGGREVQACAILIALAVSLQTLAFWKAARWMGLSKGASLVCGWISPVLSAGPVVGNHQFISYLVPCFGLFTQALAVPSFVLTIGWCLKNYVKEKPPSSFDGFSIGLGIGITFLLHQFYGYTAVLSFGVFTVFILVRKPRVISLLAFLGFSGLAFLLVSGYQLWSLIQDLPLIGKSPTLPLNRTFGIGIEAVLTNLFSGGMLDRDRLPIITTLVVLGLLFGVSKNRPKALFPLVTLAVLFSALLAGPRTMGSLLNWIPGLSSAHYDRFVGGLQIVLVFIAGIYGNKKAHPELTQAEKYLRALWQKRGPPKEKESPQKRL